MSDLLFIPSGRFVDPAMQVEFGRLPPAFLPLKNGVLLQRQMENFNSAPNARLLSLPDDFALAPWAESLVSQLGFALVRTTQSLSLGEAVANAIKADGRFEGGLRILHGDTLITDLDLAQADIVSMHKPESAGYWAHIESSEQAERFRTSFVEDERELALSGYFSFSSAKDFLDAIDAAGGDFIAALGLYAKRRPLGEMTDGRWYDFGHLKTYFSSRQAFSTERHFNSLTFSRRTVSKTSKQSEKLAAECAWYENLPPRMQLYAPRLLEEAVGVNGEFTYEIEYFHLCTLSELFVFCDVPLQEWRRIAASCIEFLRECRSYQGDPIAPLDELYKAKTFTRLRAYCEVSGVDSERKWRLNGENVGSLRDAAAKALDRLATNDGAPIMHGDFCFSNILYDARASMIRVIDPRGGVDPSQPSIFGDARYDLGKLHHSYAGYYDLILAGRYDFVEHGPYDVSLTFDLTPKQREIERLFARLLIGAELVQPDEAHAVSILLFLSMAPLHADRPDRQKAFIANALRLAAMLSGDENEKADP